MNKLTCLSLVGLLSTACTEPTPSSTDKTIAGCLQYQDTSHLEAPNHGPHPNSRAISESIQAVLFKLVPECRPSEEASFTVYTAIYGANAWAFSPTNGSSVHADSQIHLFGPDDSNCFPPQRVAIWDYPNGEAFADAVVTRFEYALACYKAE